MANPIYVIGSSNTDMVIQTEKLPMPGQTVMGKNFLTNPGGKGANQAVAAARLGAKVTFVANTGDDLFGKQSLIHFERENIDISFVSVDDNLPSGVALIGVDAHGENIIMVAPGSNKNLDTQKVNKALQGISTDTIILLQLEIPMETVAYALKKGNSAGCRVILNPAPATNIDIELMRYIDVITPNESEASILTGIPVTDLNSAQRSAQRLRDMGVQNIVITLGAKGAFLLNESVQKHIETQPVSAVDTTAAGDCFNGALAVGLSEGMALDEAVSFACRAASISVTRMGAQSSMPHRKEVEELLLQTPNRKI